MLFATYPTWSQIQELRAKISCRRMYDPVTGSFEQGNIQDWQHAAMYAAFVISGAVDLIGFYSPPGLLPQGTEHVGPLSGAIRIK